MIQYGCKEYYCPIELAIDLISGKWKPRIIWFLGEKTRRFGELEKLMPDTSRKVLIQQLRELETDGIIGRRVFAEIPPKVEYSLTKNGELLIQVFKSLQSWGIRMIENKPDDTETRWV